MSGFVPELRAQLVEAAAREQARRLPRRPEPRPRALALAGAAALLMLLVAIAALGGLQPEPRVADRAPQPAPEGRELFGGSLQPGVRYRTTDFVPALSFAVADDDWFAEDASGVDVLWLDRRNRTGEPGGEHAPVTTLGFHRLSRVHEADVRGLRASLAAAPADIHGWLARHPDVRVGPRRPATVAGVPGTVFEAEISFRRPAHRDPWCWRRFRELCTALAPGFVLPDGSRLRTYVLPAGPEPLLITLLALPGGDLADLEEPAARLLDTLRIGITPP
jgi:hypothetical protein